MTMTSEERRQRARSAMDKNAERSGRARRPRNKTSIGGTRDAAGITEASVRHQSSAERTERTESAERTERTGRTERTERADRTARTQRTNRAERMSAAAGEETRVRRQRQGSAPEGPDLSRVLIIAAAVVLLLVLIFGVRALIGHSRKKAQESSSMAESASVEASIEESIAESIAAEPETEAPAAVLEKAELLAAMYDYDAAIELLKEQTDYAENAEAQAAAARYEEIKSTLVRQDIHEITHVFFHILMPDPANALDSAKWGKQADGYNSLMTTIPEFEKMLQEMYDKGFVLVRMHDMAHMEKQSDGSEKMVEGDIMLPPGKKGVVMSEDDVCYYEYMEGAGFADRMIIGEDGRPTLHLTDPDGTEHVGDYDLVPILDHFIDEHPDFSYRGAKAIIAFTGYNGILGYRTDETYDPLFDKAAVGYGSAMTPNPNIEEDRKEAVRVLKALVDDGYELASHSWGHRDMGAIEMSSFRTDTNRWDKNVNSLIREATGENCDILIYPKGADVADWHSYSHSNERFDYLYQKGFRYFANVDSSQYWVQAGDDYLRQGRRALDGYNMWLDIAGGKNRMKDLFDDVSAIFDPARPTPVPAY